MGSNISRRIGVGRALGFLDQGALDALCDAEIEHIAVCTQELELFTRRFEALIKDMDNEFGKRIRDMPDEQEKESSASYAKDKARSML